jgi:hypothetical protein
MPVVIFLACLNLEQKSSFMDGHRLEFIYYLRKKTGIFILNTYISPSSSKSGMDHLF